MLDQNQIDSMAGQDVYGSDGDKIGTVGQIYVDDQSGTPDWVSVRTGLFGLKESFVPLTDATLQGDQLTVPYTKAFVKDAPNVDEDVHLSVEQERELYAYYSRTDYDNATTGTVTGGMGDDSGDATTAGTAGGRTDRDDATREADRVGGERSGPSTDDAMTVSEERLNVGTQQQEVGRARLRKHVVTENVTQTVPVQREEVRVEREPITEANRDDALSGPAISEEEHEVVLHEERPVVEKEAVPVERVRLETETVTDRETVSGDVRKERVDVEDDASATDRR